MSAFPETLRTWRKAKRFSQLALAVEADVSSRHISFLETGRAQPSRDMIARLGDALQLPLAARNQMLTLAGFAARYPGRAWDDEAMAPVREAVNHMLANHAPFPALALDRLWSIVQLNDPASTLFGQLGVRAGDSLLDVLTSPMAPVLIENWSEVVHHIVLRLRTESAAQGGVGELDEAADKLGEVQQADPSDQLPVIPIVLAFDGHRLSLFSTLAQFGTPEDLTLDDLRIELYFPTDQQTKTVLENMAID